MRGVPDYISPIVSYRLWQRDVAGLRSLNGEVWQPGKPLEAGCRRCESARLGARAGQSPHTAPSIECSCGIYACKRLEHLRKCDSRGSLVQGQVSLWGMVVEHEYGWRAQYAYPKSLFLLPELLPLTLKEVQSRLLALISYRCDIFVIHDHASLPLWKENAGFEAAGLDFLMRRGSTWYARSKQESMMGPGDRIAIGGRGIAVIEAIDNTWIQAVLGNKTVVRIARQCVSWNRQIVRWEAENSGCVEANDRG